MKVLVEDLNNVKLKLTSSNYSGEGRKQIYSATAAHSTQANFQYASPSQMRMNDMTM